jgi:uncharacterized protein
LSEVEVASALARLAREASISTAERDRALAMLTEDFETFWVVELIPEVASLARALLARHSIRAADAIQLASCLYIRREIAANVPLVVFDNRLGNAASNENVLVIPARARNEP